ncbi:amino acid permease [Brevibacillus formosus]|uniref:Amino acid permease n=1 Tax=Brevibacillus formosus TaxID=54913 RepID=A0A837KL05_9BACL|nr:amino acid permease [Brevibacillus formosus]KLH96949.1 amino acid permease [Brevibacillus formosus]MED1955379.1 amino acid permease [Brevibacillus formosus]PSJ96982.1 amino acid permease [Brevibacillus formosus]GED58624.1 amino acid permease [Brevibacillus formosus]
MSWKNQLLRKKSVTQMLEQVDKTESSLKKSLGAFDLTMLGIGAIMGTGIFVLTGVAAALHAGPALVLSFVIAALACVFAALCYAEFASTVPVSGSAYTYSYAAFGEFVAWMIGWDLILEYGVACAAVASGWSGYAQGLLAGFNIHLPHALTSAFDASKGTIIDLPAVLIIVIITALLMKGTKESASLNTIMVLIKVAVVILFLVVGVMYVKPENWSPFMPFGFAGVATGAATVFFAFIGFDAVSSAAEEVRNPQRDMPIGIISSLLVCTILYIAVSLTLTGIVPYHLLNVKNPVAFALSYVNQDWVAGFISLGAIVGITTVLLVMMYGQARMFFAMSRDGLLPELFSHVHPRTQVPQKSTLVVAALVATFGGLLPLSSLAQLTKVGFLGWLSVGAIIYFLYGRKHSRLAAKDDSSQT